MLGLRSRSRRSDAVTAELSVMTGAIAPWRETNTTIDEVAASEGRSA